MRSIVTGSPPWKLQATFADVTSGMTSSSLPSDQLPKLSPRSQLMSKVRSACRMRSRSVSRRGRARRRHRRRPHALVIDRERAHAATYLRVHLVELLHDLDEADDAAVLDDVALGDERRRVGVGMVVKTPGIGDRTTFSSDTGCSYRLRWYARVRALARLPARRERLVEGHRGETDVLVGLRLTDAIEVGADDRRDRGVAAAGDRVGEQRDRLDATRHLDGADGVAEVDDVRGVAPAPGGGSRSTNASGSPRKR